MLGVCSSVFRHTFGALLSSGIDDDDFDDDDDDDNGHCCSAVSFSSTRVSTPRFTR